MHGEFEEEEEMVRDNQQYAQLLFLTCYSWDIGLVFPVLSLLFSSLLVSVHILFEGDS